MLHTFLNTLFPQHEKKRNLWRLPTANDSIDESDTSLNGQSTFKYFGIVLDDSLLFNDHMDYMRMKISKILGMFSSLKPSIRLEAVKRLYKAIVLPVLD